MTTPAGLLVAPGASAKRDHRTLVALDDGLTVPVERVEFTSRSEAKIHGQLREDIARFADRIGADPASIVIGGRSFGGRMCSTLAAAGHPVAGLALLSYPLHPPGKPDKLRVEHFGALEVPCLFLSGTRDPFGTPDELRTHTATIPASVDLVFLEGQRHDPRNDDDVVAAVAAWLDTL